MSDFIICDAEQNDGKRIAELEKMYFSEPWSEKSVIDEINAENSIFLVCRSTENIVLGYVSGRNNCGEFYINNIAVDENYRNNGLGFLLMSEIISRAKNSDCLFLTLEVRASNTAACGLYEKCGMQKVGVRRNFYRHPTEDAVLYTVYFNKTENIQ